MKKFFKLALAAVAVIVVMFGAYALYEYSEGPKFAVEPEVPQMENADSAKLGCFIWKLSHDIHVNEKLSCIYDGAKTGFDVTVGPTGWPVGSSLKWEVALFEGRDAYYARMILHEYMLWWSWDNPYLAVKIPKRNVNGNPRNDEKFRWNMLWAITHATGRTYNYSPYINNAVIREINGHYVYFDHYGCHYEKYLVISDSALDW